MSHRPDFLNIVARSKLGKGDDWRWCKWNAIADGYHVWGGVPRPKKSGPNKGRPKWDDPLDECLVTGREMAEAEAAYEASTGKCRVCGGTGQQWTGWSAKSGNEYRPCTRCGATGRAPEAAEAPSV